MEKYWREAIRVARESGVGFTEEQRDKATDFQTCACGEQDPRIPRSPYGAPTDPTLRNLGLRFLDTVMCDRFDEADRVLDLIEVRAAVLALLGGGE